MLRSAGIFLHLLQWRSVFSLRKTTTKRGSKKREYILAQERQCSGELGAFYYLFLATSVFTHHQNMVQETRGSLIARWLLQLGDTSRSTQTLGLITPA